jgi:hypothetical protein
MRMFASNFRLVITTSMASGIRQAFGTMTMALHVGLTSRERWRVLDPQAHSKSRSRSSGGQRTSK